MREIEKNTDFQNMSMGNILAEVPKAKMNLKLLCAEDVTLHRCEVLPSYVQ